LAFSTASTDRKRIALAIESCETGLVMGTLLRCVDAASPRRRSGFGSIAGVDRRARILLSIEGAGALTAASSIA